MDQYAVFGNPIAHSKSPYIHQLFAQQCQQDMQYQALLAEPNCFAQAINDFIQQGGKGCNVTVPFKQDAFVLASELSSHARIAGAVNTLSFSPDRKIIGDNTDGRGFIADLHFHHIELVNKRILLIGAGGAARGIIAPLLAQQPATLIITNRTVQKAEELATLGQSLSVNTTIRGVGLADLRDKPFDLVINASSAGLRGAIPAIEAQIIHHQTVCYDMVYAREQTAFNQWAQAQGADSTIDGLGMLVEQAALSFEIWRGVKPDTQQVRTLLRREI